MTSESAYVFLDQIPPLGPGCSSVKTNSPFVTISVIMELEFAVPTIKTKDLFGISTPSFTMCTSSFKTFSKSFFKSFMVEISTALEFSPVIK